MPEGVVIKVAAERECLCSIDMEATAEQNGMAMLKFGAVPHYNFWLKPTRVMVDPGIAIYDEAATIDPATWFQLIHESIRSMSPRGYYDLFVQKWPGPEPGPPDREPVSLPSAEEPDYNLD